MKVDKHVELTLRDEEFLIGGILLRPSAIYEAIEIISSKDFLSDGFAKVFSAIHVLSSLGVPLVLSNIAQELNRIDALDAIGGPKRLAELLNQSVPHHVRYYAEEVARWSRRRKLIEMVESFKRQIDIDPVFDVDAIASEMSSAGLLVSDIGNSNQKSCEKIVADKLLKLEVS